MVMTTTNNSDAHNGDGSTVAFAFTFRVLAEGDIDVYVGGTLQTITTHYTVGGTLPGTGTITFVSAPASGTDNVVFVRNMDTDMQTDLTAAGAFPAQTVEEALEKVTMLIQQLEHQMQKRPGLVDSSPNTISVVLPELSGNAGKVVAVNSGETGFEYIAN